MSGKYDIDRDLSLRGLERDTPTTEEFQAAHIDELKRQLAEKDKEIERLRSALTRLASPKAFYLSRATNTEDRMRNQTAHHQNGLGNSSLGVCRKSTGADRMSETKPGMSSLN